tara:strand:- start:3860 stop:5386 length:1527 start_codon:yes stop_codon:yes gene_type:complete
MKYCIYITPHSNKDVLLAFTDVAKVFYETLIDYGHDVIIVHTNDIHSGRKYIVLGLHVNIDAYIPANSIIVNLEQLYNNGIDENYFNILAKHEVWDYSASNINFLKTKSITNVIKIDMGYSKCLEHVFDFSPAKPLNLKSKNSQANNELNIHDCYILNKKSEVDRLAHAILECDKYNLSSYSINSEKAALKMIAQRKDKKPSLIIRDDIKFMNLDLIKHIKRLPGIVYLNYQVDLGKEKTDSPYLFTAKVSSYNSYLITPDMARKSLKGDKVKTYIFEDNGEQVVETVWANKIKNYIYIHVAGLNNWVQILKDIFNKIEISGLYDFVDEIRICYLGDIEKMKEMETMISDKEKMVIHKKQTDLSIYERITLNAIHEDSQKEEFNVLYLHTKGVTRGDSKGVLDWINYMHHFLITDYQNCVDNLKSYETVSCNLRNEPEMHYSGNLWWSRSDYIKTLAPKIGPAYLDPEMWLLRGQGEFLSVFESKKNHYKERFYDTEYVGKAYLNAVY